MAQDPEKPRVPAQNNSTDGPIEWQNDKNPNPTADEPANTKRDIESDQTEKSDSAA